MVLLKEATKAVCMMPYWFVFCGNEHGPDGTRAIIQQLLVKLSSSKYIQLVLTQFTTTPPPTRTDTTQQRCAAIMSAAPASVAGALSCLLLFCLVEHDEQPTQAQITHPTRPPWQP